MDLSHVLLPFLRAKKEVDEVIGMKQEISYEDLSQLVYLSQVLGLENHDSWLVSLLNSVYLS